MSSLEFEWLVEDRVLKEKISGDITPELIQEQEEKMTQYLENTDAALLHLLADCTELKSLPKVTEFETFTWTSHDNLGWVVVYGVDRPLVEFIASVVLQMAGTRFRLFDTREEAVEFLQKMDTTLPGLKEQLK